MNVKEWNEKVEYVVRAMTGEVSPYLTPISAELEENWGN